MQTEHTVVFQPAEIERIVHRKAVIKIREKVKVDIIRNISALLKAVYKHKTKQAPSSVFSTLCVFGLSYQPVLKIGEIRVQIFASVWNGARAGREIE
jgi:hypothetical protein